MMTIHVVLAALTTGTLLAIFVALVTFMEKNEYATVNAPGLLTFIAVTTMTALIFSITLLVKLNS